MFNTSKFYFFLHWIFFVSQVSQQCLHYFRLVDYSYISKLLSCLDKSTTLRVKTKNYVRTFKRVEFFHSKKLSNYCVWNLELVSSEISKTRNGFLCMNYRFSKSTNKRRCLYRNKYMFIVAFWRVFCTKFSIHIIKKRNEIFEIGLPPFTNCLWI